MIRATRKGDHATLRALYRAAFPDEDLTNVLAALLADDTVLSLTTETRDGPISHVALTPCRIAATETHPAPVLAAGDTFGKPAYLLGPLCVAPAAQKRGFGSKLVADALGRIASRPGKPPVLVLGDPGYYARFGFRPEPYTAAPFALPEGWDAAWQSLAFDRQPLPEGVLHVPAAWHDAALWSDGSEVGPNGSTDTDIP
ncbi:MAG: N-acetyltransferase [Pseudomonadota bacterium]